MADLADFQAAMTGVPFSQGIGLRPLGSPGPLGRSAARSPVTTRPETTAIPAEKSLALLAAVLLGDLSEAGLSGG